MNNYKKVDFTDKNISSIMKGLAAFIVMIGHFLTYLDVNNIVYFFFSGTLCVGIFFFYSGYGLELSLKNKSKYLDNFIIDKIKKLYMPYIVANVIYYIIQVSLNIVHFEWNVFLLTILGLRVSNRVLWYMLHLFVCEILFYLINKIKILEKNKKILYIILYVLYIILCVKFDISNWWYLSTSCFIFGLLFEDIKNIIYNINKNIKISLIILFFILYGLLFVAQRYNLSIPIIPTNYYITMLYLIVCPLLVICLNCLKYPKTDDLHNIYIYILCKLECISFNIYLYHNAVGLLIENVLNCSQIAKFIIKIIATIILSICIYLIQDTKKGRKNVK